jgi:hypothetical protein
MWTSDKNALDLNNWAMSEMSESISIYVSLDYWQSQRFNVYSLSGLQIIIYSVHLP